MVVVAVVVVVVVVGRAGCPPLPLPLFPPLPSLRFFTAAFSQPPTPHVSTSPVPLTPAVAKRPYAMTVSLRRYLVKWRGWPASDNSWQTKASFADGILGFGFDLALLWLWRWGILHSMRPPCLRTLCAVGSLVPVLTGCCGVLAI